MEEYEIHIYQFFKLFAQFEMALKVLNYAQFRGYIIIDWSTFSKDIHKSFQENKDSVKDSINYLNSSPPLQQIIKDKKLDWSPAKINNKKVETEILIDHIKRVRNNLFHGGKYSGRTDDEYKRDYELITHSRIILEYILTLRSDIKEIIENP